MTSRTIAGDGKVSPALDLAEILLINAVGGRGKDGERSTAKPDEQCR
jgi:hypothetical protein